MAEALLRHLLGEQPGIDLASAGFQTRDRLGEFAGWLSPFVGQGGESPSS